MKHGFCVVGAGPVGSIAAKRASRKNDVILVGGERRVQCAGVISVSGLGQLGISAGSYVLNKVRGAKLVAPSGFEVAIDGKEAKAYVVDRLAFDEHLLNDAVNAGVKYVPTMVESIDGSVKTSGGGEIHSDKIVLATGTNYSLQKKLGLDCPKEFLVGAQYEMEVACDSDFVELHFVVPDFFAWVVPVDGYARIGLCTRQKAKNHLDDFVGSLRKAGRLKSERKISEIYGVIPIYSPSIRTQYEKMLTVGDAAGQVKASTGGGVIFGGLCAEFVDSENYEREWRRRIGGELKLHLMLHRFMSKMKPSNMERLIRLAGSNQAAIENGGDMDYAEKTLKNVLTNPKFTTQLLANAPYFLSDLI